MNQSMWRTRSTGQGQQHLQTAISALQVLRGCHRLLTQTAVGADKKQQIFVAKTEPWQAHLRALVTTMAQYGFNPTAIGALAARDAGVVLRDPDRLAVQFEMLRAFFAPYGDALAVLPRMTKGVPGCLPAVVPEAMRTVDSGRKSGRHADVSCVHRAMLFAHSDVLSWTREGLTQHVRKLVAVGLFEGETEARQGCMLRPWLLQSRQARWYLERKAAVLEAGGSMDDALAACCATGAVARALPVLMLWQHTQCAAPNASCQLSFAIVVALDQCARLHGGDSAHLHSAKLIEVYVCAGHRSASPAASMLKHVLVRF